VSKPGLGGAVAVSALAHLGLGLSLMLAGRPYLPPAHGEATAAKAGKVAAPVRVRLMGPGANNPVLGQFAAGAGVSEALAALDRGASPAPSEARSSASAATSSASEVPSSARAAQAASRNRRDFATGVPSSEEERPSGASGVPSNLSEAPSSPSGVLAGASGVPSGPSGVLAGASGVLSNPSGVLAGASGVPSSPSGVLSNPSGVLSNPSGVLSNPSGVLSSPSGVPFSPSEVEGPAAFAAAAGGSAGALPGRHVAAAGSGAAAPAGTPEGLAGPGRAGGFVDAAELHRRLDASAQRCYPAAALRFRLEGEVPINFCLDGSGGLSTVTLQGSTGSPILDRAAQGCVVQGAVPLPATSGCYDVQVRFAQKQ
jgi:TonB family protein